MRRHVTELKGFMLQSTYKPKTVYCFRKTSVSELLKHADGGIVSFVTRCTLVILFGWRIATISPQSATDRCQPNMASLTHDRALRHESVARSTRHWR